MFILGPHEIFISKIEFEASNCSAKARLKIRKKHSNERIVFAVKYTIVSENNIISRSTSHF